MLAGCKLLSLLPYKIMFKAAKSLIPNQVEAIIDQLSQLPQYTIGRKPDNAIVLPDPKISGQHARLISCGPTSFILEDLASKNGTFVNNLRITRKIIDVQDVVRLAESEFTVAELIATSRQKTIEPSLPSADKADPLNFTIEFAALREVYEQYPQLRKDCRSRDKMIRTGSVIISSIVGVSAFLTTGGGALTLLPMLSSAGLSMLIPTLCSTLLSTEEKLEIIEKEFRKRYRCPNSACRDPFYTREWEQLAQQKTCPRCKAVWVK